MYALFKPELMQHAKNVYDQHVNFENKDISIGELQRYQLSQLQKTLLYAKENSPFYQKQLAALSVDDIHAFSLGKISSLPFTSKGDLQAQGHLLPSLPLHRAWIYYETTGTTGSPTPCPRNEIDSIHNNTPLIIRYRDIFNQHGQQHIVGVMGPTELHSTGDTFEDVLRSLGHTVVKMWPRSPVVGMKRVAALIKELNITALVCTPAVAIAFARYLFASNTLPAEVGIKVILTLGELTTPALLRNIGQVWNASVYNCMYASQESSILAASRADGTLYSVPLNNYYEIIDPQTGDVVDMEQYAEGELVITHLYAGQKPLIRYRTGDMVRATLTKEGSWQLVPIGRVRDTLMLNDQNFCAYDIEAALLENLDGCLDYHIQIDKQQGADHLTVTLEISPTQEIEERQLLALRQRIEDRLQVAVTLVLAETTSITATSAMVSWKAARLHDTRPNGDNRDRNAALALLSGGFK